MDIPQKYKNNLFCKIYALCMLIELRVLNCNDTYLILATNGATNGASGRRRENPMSLSKYREMSSEILF